MIVGLRMETKTPRTEAESQWLSLVCQKVLKNWEGPEDREAQHPKRQCKCGHWYRWHVAWGEAHLCIVSPLVKIRPSVGISVSQAPVTYIPHLLSFANSYTPSVLLFMQHFSSYLFFYFSKYLTLTKNTWNHRFAVPVIFLPTGIKYRSA